MLNRSMCFIKVNGVCILLWLFTVHKLLVVVRTVSFWINLNAQSLFIPPTRKYLRRDRRACSRNVHPTVGVIFCDSFHRTCSRSLHLTVPLLPCVAMETAVYEHLHLWTLSLFNYYVLMKTLVRLDVMWFCHLSLRPRCSLKVSWHEFCHSLFHQCSLAFNPQIIIPFSFLG